MKNLLKSSIAFILLIAISSNINAKKASIKLDLKKGDSFISEMSMTNNIDQEMMGQKISMQQNMNISMLMKVTEITTDGSYTIEQTYSRVKMDMLVNGQAMKFDSDSATKDSKLASLGKIIGTVISFDVTPLGKVSNIKGMKEMIEKFQDSPQAAAMLKNLTNEDMIVSYFSYIPQKSVRKGDSYVASIKMEQLMGMEIETNYTVIDINKGSVNLDMNTAISFSPDEPIEQNGLKMMMSGSGTQTGGFIIDSKTGMPKSSNMTQKIDMNMSFKNPQNGEDMTIPMKVITTATTSTSKE